VAKSTLSDFQGHTRPAQVGDLCVLLEPTPGGYSPGQERQQDLQLRFGGTLIERLHLTCQRFDCQDPQTLKACLAGLKKVVADTEQFALQAIGLETLYVPVRETNILKWEVEVHHTLRHFVAEIRRALLLQGIEPHYVADFVPNLVAALKDVPEVSEERLAQEVGLPYSLFDTGQLVVSRIHGPNEFVIEGIVPWQQAEP
jgi:hypothetical protein